MRTTFLAHLIVLHVNRISYVVPHFPIFSTFPSIHVSCVHLLITLFSDTVNVRDQVPHPHKTRVAAIVLYVLKTKDY